MMENKQQYQGLTSAQVEESRRLHGENVLTPPEKTPARRSVRETPPVPRENGAPGAPSGWRNIRRG